MLTINMINVSDFYYGNLSYTIQLCVVLQSGYIFKNYIAALF